MNPSEPDPPAAPDRTGVHEAGQPRIATGGRKELGLIGWGITRGSGALMGTTPPNLFRTLGRNRRLFRGWLRFASSMMPNGRLPRRETELVILRVAHLSECRYEFDHHVHLGAQVGLTDDDVTRVVDGPEAHGWSEREQVLLAATDQLHATSDLDDEMWAGLREHLDDARSLELLFLVGHYRMLAAAINTLRIQPDRPHPTRASAWGDRLATRVARRRR